MELFGFEQGVKQHNDHPFVLKQTVTIITDGKHYKAGQTGKVVSDHYLNCVAIIIHGNSATRHFIPVAHLKG